MDILSLDIKKIRITYMIIAALFTLCAIISAFLHHIYVALAFILLASLMIFFGGILISFLFRIKKEKGSE
ncbi:MAG TPA: hypothetical protein VGK13_03275 [Methanocellaceae archaeon]